MPTPRKDADVPKKLIKWGLIIFLVFFVATRPTDAAGSVKRLGSGLMGGLDGVAEFLRVLVS
jgi:hypothetical protein